MLTAFAYFFHIDLKSGPREDHRTANHGVLKEHEARARTADLAHQHGISKATFHSWKPISEAKR